MGGLDRVPKRLPALVGGACIALSCTGAAVAADEQARVTKAFHWTFGDQCTGGFPGSEGPEPPDHWEIAYTLPYADQPAKASLYRFLCNVGAYNLVHVYYLVTEQEGIVPVAFAEPELDVSYSVPEDTTSAVESYAITGYGTRHMLINSEFDPESNTIVSADHWRGLGDASSSGEWVFSQGTFVLTRFDVDASYDGEIDMTRVLALGGS